MTIPSEKLYALIEFRHGPELLLMLTAVEDDRALYLFRDVTGKHKTNVMEPIREMKFITRIHKKDARKAIDGDDMLWAENRGECCSVHDEVEVKREEANAGNVSKSGKRSVKAVDTDPNGEKLF
ncbi:hypothetical protein Tco_0967441 [Tanacetum coccineum]